MPSDTRRGIAAAKWLNWNRIEHAILSNFELHPSHFSAATHPRRSCFASAGWDSLANHSLGLITLGFARAMTCLSNNWLGGYSRWSERLLCPLSCRWRPDWHPCHPSLTIGGIRDRRFQFCTLLTDQQPRMRLAAGNIRNCATHAAAMEFVLELEANLSPPVQRDGMLNHSNNVDASSASNNQHHKASTHFAGRDVSSSFIVANRRFEERCT